MDLSIIIPVYNVEKYLEECLESIYKIKGIEKEVIIVNDGSTDNSKEILKKYKEKYKEETIIINQKNKGLSGARNSGLRIAKGEYISFIDSDDYIDSEKYVKLVNKTKELNLDIGFGDFKYLQEGKMYSTDEMIKRMELLSRLDIMKGLEFWERDISVNQRDMRVEVWTNIYKRDLLIKNNLFFTEGLLHEDSMFTPKVVYYSERVKYFPIDFYFYRIRKNSIMGNINVKNYIHKMYIAQELQAFKKNKNISLFCWDTMIFSLYFGSVRKAKIKNYDLYEDINKNNKKLTKISKIKRVLIPIYHLFSESIQIKI